MNRNKITAVFCMLLALSLTALTSCSKNKTNNSQKTQINKKPVREPWKPTKKKLCVVFGYGYTSEFWVHKETQHLKDYYGLSDEEFSETSGLIIPLSWPEDFLIGKTGRISKLNEILSDADICGIIMLGAPEYSNNALAKFREDKDESEFFPIYSLFPQDEILAIEAVSDFVLDRSVEASDNIEEIENAKEEISQVIINGIENIIDNSIEYIISNPKPLKADPELLTHVKKIVGSDYSIKRYVDPETGLSSINHFIIEENK
ncbi:MAG: hypothetical protein KBT21_07385 [Treponema sp.]|nr:hypothetical protein [Candidatus Treponema merdequi]